jgi:hypothetical protein
VTIAAAPGAGQAEESCLFVYPVGGIGKYSMSVAGLIHIFAVPAGALHT